MADFTLFFDLLLDAVFLAIFDLLDLEQLLLVMLILCVFLVSNAIHNIAKLFLLSTSTGKCFLKCLVLCILLILKSIIDVSHLSIQVRHHGSLLISTQIALIQPLLETVKDLALHLVILVKLAMERLFLLSLNLLLHLVVVLFFLLRLTIHQLSDLSLQL